MHPSSTGFPTNHEGGSSDGSSRTAARAGSGRGRGGRGGNRGRGGVRTGLSLGRTFFHTVASVFLYVLSFFLSSWDRPGGGRGSFHGPPADCERSRWTVNRKGLYIISP